MGTEADLDAVEHERRYSMTKPPPVTQRRDQHERFIETARQLECDEDKKGFEEKLKRIARAKPKPGKKD